jgi:hypothetical protein
MNGSYNLILKSKYSNSKLRFLKKERKFQTQKKHLYCINETYFTHFKIK